MKCISVVIQQPRSPDSKSSVACWWEQCICLRIWHVLVGKRTAVWGVVFHFHRHINSAPVTHLHKYQDRYTQLFGKNEPKMKFKLFFSVTYQICQTMLFFLTHSSSLRSRRFPVHLWHPHFLRIKAFLDENVTQSCSAAIVMLRTCLCACRCETMSHEERQTKESCGWGSSARTQGLWHWTGRLFFPFTLCLSHTFHISRLWWKQRLTFIF